MSPQEMRGLRGGLKNKEEQWVGVRVNKWQIKYKIKNPHWLVSNMQNKPAVEPRVGKMRSQLCFLSCLVHLADQALGPMHTSVAEVLP